MSNEHPAPEVGQYVDVDLTTPEDRRKALIDQVESALGHHATLHQALLCALTAFMGSMMRELLASASIVPLEVTDPYIAATVDRILNAGTVDVRGLMMIGDIAYWCHAESERQPIMSELESLRPKDERK